MTQTAHGEARFDPREITLEEAGDDAAYDWKLRQPLTWTGVLRRKHVDIKVPATPSDPFTTDLASVPRSLTWLFPRYGKYTKAAVLHDYLCQHFQDPGPQAAGLKDRSDADEIFRAAMNDLGVPWARRWLMWSAVSWATLFGSIWPGRTSNPVLRWIGRVALVAAVIVGAFTIVDTGIVGAIRHHHGLARWWRIAAFGGAFFVIAAIVVMVCGYIAHGRWDRWLVYLGALGMTIASVGLIAAGAVIAVLLVGYLFVESPRSWVRAVIGGILRMFRISEPAPRSAPKQQRLEAIRTS